MLEAIKKILAESWLANLLGIGGGLLGAYTFIDSHLLGFKPRIYIGTKIAGHITREINNKFLDSIICSLELCNHRQKYGVIYDFAVKIYRSNEINPHPFIYYATDILDNIPSDVSVLDTKERKVFNPIAVLPYANTSRTIVLSEVISNSKMSLSGDETYFMEAYYQRKPKGKWYHIDTLYLYKIQKSLESDKYVLYSVLDNYETREKLKHNKRHIKTELYKGGMDKMLLRYKFTILWMIKYPFARIKDALLTIPFYTMFVSVYLFDKFIRLPLMKKYGAKIEKLRFVGSSTESMAVRDRAFDKAYSYLEELVTKINSKSLEEDAKLLIKREKDKIIVTRYKRTLEFYKSGDVNITAHDVRDDRNAKLNFSISLKNSIWNKKYWYLYNYGFISIKSFVMKTLDAFLVHSNY